MNALKSSTLVAFAVFGAWAIYPAAITPPASAAPARAAPAWRNATWLNAEKPVALDSLRGKVVLMNFWVFTCGNCTRTIPSLRALDAKYRTAGLQLIGIHTPEFGPSSGEHDRQNVAAANARLGVSWPVAQDNDEATWRLYNIQYWPSFVLIDRKGNIRYEGYGEFHPDDRSFAIWQSRIESLLAEPQ